MENLIENSNLPQPQIQPQPKIPPLFTVIFKDKTMYEGNTTYQETGWLQIPNKPIASIVYRLPDFNHLVLSNYDHYFHMVTCMMDITGDRRGISTIQHACLMGVRCGKVDSYRITLLELLNGRYRLGDIVKRSFKINSPFIQGLNKDNFRPLFSK